MAEKYLPFYNISQPVGQGGVNSSEDVSLVQLFLSEVGKVPPHPIPPPTTPLLVNGIASPLLNEWILWFQKAVKQAGKQIIVDGRIDPARIHDGSYYGGRGTIAHLNISYRKRFRANHNALETAPNCPGQLKGKFVGVETAQQ